MTQHALYVPALMSYLLVACDKAPHVTAVVKRSTLEQELIYFFFLFFILQLISCKNQTVNSWWSHICSALGPPDCYYPHLFAVCVPVRTPLFGSGPYEALN